MGPLPHHLTMLGGGSRDPAFTALPLAAGSSLDDGIPVVRADDSELAALNDSSPTSAARKGWRTGACHRACRAMTPRTESPRCSSSTGARRSAPDAHRHHQQLARPAERSVARLLGACTTVRSAAPRASCAFDRVSPGTTTSRHEVGSVLAGLGPVQLSPKRVVAASPSRSRECRDRPGSLQGLVSPSASVFRQLSDPHRVRR